ncbi:MAG: putative metalloprotease CJM1_0395 family protein [Pseudomonas sp.]|uniref:putative metalloprotease CJM1_0395 family protein n=1 Tax=Pseudomonas sp. TaxID=306 RepID=UPI002718DA2F|nr:putative metalloprotease CJM1_0395 family protein [Pseudomonas sp.]MDO9620206.1 putative metalloprotease CJM1_0395 family protein [Pseudomonas sp.]MDP2446687.1 putative metalloprotease CJM1_0395 family protein [Pseudomonas sp.]MDZ4332687.1 putative metalloprotease CJM1_0395 family protein [Pseudomonas sp.]
MSPDITRAAQAPITASQPLADEQSASAREEADKPADASANSDKSKTAEGEPSPQQQRLEQLEVTKLVSRDQEVRTHEQAHAAIGGRYAGAPSYTYERGPDGKRYAVGGEVGIDTSPIPSDPEATLRKMEVVIRAALAPAEPSAQDRQVAAQAQAQMAEARALLAQQQRSEAEAASEARAEQRKKAEEEKPEEEEKSTAPVQQDRPPPPSLDLYKQLSGLQAPAPVVDLVA